MIKGVKRKEEAPLGLSRGSPIILNKRKQSREKETKKIFLHHIEKKKVKSIKYPCR